MCLVVFIIKVNQDAYFDSWENLMTLDAVHIKTDFKISWSLLPHHRICAAAALNLDVQTLNSVYVHWGSPTQLASWGASAGNTACNMIGIICNAENNVVSLSLHDIPTGAFDPLLFTLTSLSKLVLVNVKLSGSISLQISQLTGLKEFQASSNLLTGSLPSAVSLLLSLTALEINSNQLTGTIPPQLSTLILLSHLQLGNNKFAGPLPVDLSSLNSLVILYAPFNNLSGTIPPQYSALQQLTAMVLSSNSLNGSIPVQLTSIRNLSLLVRDNQALCGPPLVFGEQASTNVGQDCPDLTSGGWHACQQAMGVRSHCVRRVDPLSLAGRCFNKRTLDWYVLHLCCWLWWATLCRSHSSIKAKIQTRVVFS